MNAVKYGLVANGSSVDASEVERADAEVVDVVLSWGDEGDRNILDVKHLAAGEELTVGEAEGCDMLVPADVLGTSCAKLVAREGEKVVLIPPPGAQVRVDGFARTEARIELALGHVAEIAIGRFALRFSLVAAGKKVKKPLLAGLFNNDGMKGVLGSAVAHGMLIAAVAAFMPGLNKTDNDDIDHDQLVLMQTLIDSAAQKEEERLHPPDANGSSDSPAPGDTLKNPEAAGAPGTAGKPEPVTNPGRMASQGDARREDATLAREHEKEMARNFGLAGMLSAFDSDPNAPVVPWGSVNNGADSQSAMGSLFGSTIGDATGTGGLGLWGNDQGGGGTANIIGLGGLNGLGNYGTCPPGAKCDGIGNRVGLLPGNHAPTAPRIRMPQTMSTNGKLDPIVIQRIIQQNSGRFRQCYEMGLRGNPSLEGHVGVKFIIDRSGAVSTAVDAGSTIADRSVSACVVRSFTSLSFPAPADGLVTVVYGFAFSPQ